MSYIVTRKSNFRYFLIVFLILVLAACAFFYYLRDSRVTSLRNNISAVLELKNDYAKVDSCTSLLYQAENNSRMYAVTADKMYLKQFSEQIQKVSAYLTDIKGDSEDQRRDLKGLVSQKKIQTENYLRLRRLTDSLVTGFIKLGMLDDRPEPKMAMPSIKKPSRQVVKLDTIKHKPEAKKKLFGRLAEAISGKSNKQGSVTIVKTENINSGNEALASSIKAYNEKQLRSIRAYYKKLYENSNRLREDEKAILLLNHKLIAEILVLLKSYKAQDVESLAEARLSMGANLNQEISELDRIALINGSLMISLILVILYHIYRLFRHEKVLLVSNKRAAQDAHAKSRFLANMSHEIRTPLNSIVGFSEQLSYGQLTEEQISQITAIRSSSEMLLEVVNEILDFSKFEVGKISFESAAFSLQNEIVEVFNSMNVLAANKNITLLNKLSFDKNIELVGDRFRLKQVIMNLLTNAIKFTSDGHVKLKAQFLPEGKKHGVLKIQVEDTGIGMAKGDLDLIFDEFSQIASTQRMTQQGTGLGLAICKKIVEQQNGKISVSSIPGKGSIFSFEIPFQIAEKKKEENAESKAQGTGDLHGKKVLVVDDNKMNVLLAQTILKKWNIIYDSAYDGKEALDLFKKNSYDLVLTDIQMPVMGGVELTHEIRYNGDFTKAATPILGVTAHVLQENREIYLKAGMNGLVLKPFLEKQLIDQIAEHI